ncbi:MAG: GTPase HflX [Candidatus Cloacimonetes bacterium]|nr:GTPase HflX [Candidatus Cloacimonadota bacterium]
MQERIDENMIKAILFGVNLPSSDHEETEYSLRELERLADTAQIEVVGKYIQNRKSIDKTTYAGIGFIGNCLDEHPEVELLIFDNELTGTQAKNIREKFKVEVTDRTEIILDIFHKHAGTREAKLQVHLAELEYQLPRLKKLWSHLDRERGQAGGSGGTSRGMGEKQIEIDRRKIMQEISKTRRELKKLDTQMIIQRKKRENEKKVCLVGYTNAGKSTLFNQLTNAGVLVENKLFATLGSTARTVNLGKGMDIILSDTVGFISNIPHKLIASFRATLKDVQDADLLLHIVDIADPAYDRYLSAVDDVLKEIGADGVPMIILANKTDLLISDGQTGFPDKDMIPISARTGKNLELLLKMLSDRLFPRQRIELLIPVDKPALLEKIHQSSEIIREQYTRDGFLVEVLMNPENVEYFKPYYRKRNSVVLD